MRKKRPTSAYLFYALLAVLMATPWVDPEGWGGVLLRLMFFAVLVVALYSVSGSPWQLALGGFLITIAAGINVAVIASNDPSLIPVALACVCLFCVMLTIVKTLYTWRSSEVNTETLYSAVLAYISAAAAFACAYGVHELLQPGSFAGKVNPTRLFPHASMADLIYFSVTTITSTGYGDLTAVTVPARHLACAEMLFGNLFPTIILARLVGLYSRS